MRGGETRIRRLPLCLDRRRWRGPVVGQRSPRGQFSARAKTRTIQGGERCQFSDLKMRAFPPVPIMDETTASIVITVEGMEVVGRWRKQGCWEQMGRWPAERKEGVARLEFRRPPPPPRGWEALGPATVNRSALGPATVNRSRTRAYRKSPCDDGSPLSTSFVRSRKPIAWPSLANAAPCCAARACTRRT